MAVLTIPTIFKAIDQMTAPIRKMQAGVHNLAVGLETGLARGERAFRKLTPALSSAAKEFLSFASTAAIAAAIVSGVHFSVQSLKDYETAVASFRTIVSDLTDKEFASFKTEISAVATITKRSTIEVASAFEMIAGLNSKFAETADGLGSVSKAAITLADASGDELSVAASNLVGIMNQFSMGALEADRAINVLAAGQAVGAANISQTSEAFKNFGSVASGANITLEQSVGLIQTLGKFSLFGAEAGTKLRGSVLQLQKAGLGYKSGQFQINDALAEAKAKMDKLSTAKKKDAFLTKTFGAENITAGRILLSNIGLYEDFTKNVTGTSEAQKAAAINNATFAKSLEQAKNQFVNWITNSESAKGALDTVRNAVVFLGDNLSDILKWGGRILIFFATWKAIMVSTRIVLGAYNIALGITGALSSTASVAIGKSTIATKAYIITAKIATAAQWLWNGAMAANPIALFIIAAAALVVGVYALSRALKTQSTAEKVHAEVQKRALENTIDQRVEIDLLFSSLKRAEVGSEKYNSTLRQLEAIQPGIIDKYNLQTGAVENLNKAHKELVDNIMKTAMAEARLELIREKTKALILAQNEGPTFGDKFKNIVSPYGTAESFKNRRIGELQAEIDELANQSVEAVNPEKSKQDATVKTQANVNLNINDPNNRVSAESDNPFVKVQTSSTQGYPQK